MYCNESVYIRSSKLNGTNYPLFSHYQGQTKHCLWHHGKNKNPNALRAAQYHGQQESNLHRNMCEQIAELVALDKRHIDYKINKYLPPSDNQNGRYPDIYVEWKEFGPFAIEFQLSNTFQSEISKRCKHYEYENIPLLWVLFGLDTTTRLSQDFKDVIRRHRGNAFVLDQKAIKASLEKRTLVLTCYLRNGDGFENPVLVRFDQLETPKSMLPFFKDHIVSPQKTIIEAKRKPWFTKLKDFKENHKLDRDYCLEPLDRSDSLLIAAAFSIVAKANDRDVNFASEHSNIKAMLNTYLHGGNLSSYTNLLTCLIANTKLNGFLDETVGEHLRRYKSENQVSENSEIWTLLRNLIPESLDPILREEWQYLDALPEWATPTNL